MSSPSSRRQRRGRCAKPAPAMARKPPPLPTRPLLWLSLAGLTLGVPVQAQDSAVNSRGWSVVPTFSVSTAYTELRGSATEQGRIGNDWITQAGPGLQWNSRSGRVQGTLDYTLLGTVHARRTELNTVTNALAGNAKVELVPGWAYIDATGNISEQGAAAYGLQQTTASLSVAANLREVATFSLSPYVRGTIGNWASYEVRLTAAATDVRKSTEGDSRNLVGSVVLRSQPLRTVGWGLQATQQRVSFSAGRATDLFRGTASVSYAPEFDLVFTLRAGQEVTTVGSVFRETYDTWGGGVRWTPTPRTTVSIDADRRYFGNGHQVAVEHRLRRTALRFTSIRDTTATGDATGVGRPITLFQLYMLQFTSIEPDPGLREQRVRELLRLTGQNPNVLVNGGLASSAVSLQRREDLSVSYVGSRGTTSLQAFTSTTEVIDRGVTQTVGERIRQAGASLSSSYRLTPLTSTTLGLSYQRTLDPQPLQPANRLTTLSLGATTALNPSTTASLGARYSLFEGAPFSNRETALTASLNVRF